MAAASALAGFPLHAAPSEEDDWLASYQSSTSYTCFASHPFSQLPTSQSPLQATCSEAFPKGLKGCTTRMMSYGNPGAPAGDYQTAASTAAFLQPHGFSASETAFSRPFEEANSAMSLAKQLKARLNGPGPERDATPAVVQAPAVAASVAAGAAAADDDDFKSWIASASAASSRSKRAAPGGSRPKKTKPPQRQDDRDASREAFESATPSGSQTPGSRSSIGSDSGLRRSLRISASGRRRQAMDYSELEAVRIRLLHATQMWAVAKVEDDDCNKYDGSDSSPEVTHEETSRRCQTSVTGRTASSQNGLAATTSATGALAVAVAANAPVSASFPRVVSAAGDAALRASPPLVAQHPARPSPFTTSAPLAAASAASSSGGATVSAGAGPWHRPFPSGSGRTAADAAAEAVVGYGKPWGEGDGSDSSDADRDCFKSADGFSTAASVPRSTSHSSTVNSVCAADGGVVRGRSSSVGCGCSRSTGSVRGAGGHHRHRSSGGHVCTAAACGSGHGEKDSVRPAAVRKTASLSRLTGLSSASLFWRFLPLSLPRPMPTCK
eukprot:TRINITY_DN74805_c0_g1_i1.p1 TRINITY_DN74805_c0_g1~~TRINITY_DN74805_c0_g1_i1.p1  ORF type:complete len:553 (+),score=-36.11 TRINITY_DN74805_c0_g1_i1:170-1828(+)